MPMPAADSEATRTPAPPQAGDVVEGETPASASERVPATRARASRKTLWLLARVGVSVALIAWLLAHANLGRVLGLLARMDLRFAALGLLAGVVGIVLSALQWQLLLRSDGVRLRLPLLTGLYFVGVTFSQFLPTSIGGDVAKATYVARLSKHGVESVTATLMQRVIGFLILLLTAFAVALAVPWLAPRLGWSLALGLLAPAAVYAVGLTALLTSSALLDWLRVERLRETRLAAALMRRAQTGGALGRALATLDRSWLKVYGKLYQVAQTVGAYRRRPRTLLAVASVSLVFYFVNNLNYYLYGQALGLRSPFWFYWVAVPITSIVTLLPISLNGYGLRETGVVALFALMGESAVAALSLSTAIEIQLLLFGLIGGGVLLALNRRGGDVAPQDAGFEAPRHDAARR